jgi:hypothetical protein
MSRYHPDGGSRHEGSFMDAKGRFSAARYVRALYTSRSMRVRPPTPIPDTRLAAPDCRNQGDMGADIQAACKAGYTPDRQEGGQR